jgi:hypothetical protein
MIRREYVTFLNSKHEVLNLRSSLREVVKDMSLSHSKVLDHSDAENEEKDGKEGKNRSVEFVSIPGPTE